MTHLTFEFKQKVDAERQGGRGEWVKKGWGEEGETVASEKPAFQLREHVP